MADRDRCMILRHRDNKRTYYELQYRNDFVHNLGDDRYLYGMYKTLRSAKKIGDLLISGFDPDKLQCEIYGTGDSSLDMSEDW